MYFASFVASNNIHNNWLVWRKKSSVQLNMPQMVFSVIIWLKNELKFWREINENPMNLNEVKTTRSKLFLLCSIPFWLKQILYAKRNDYHIQGKISIKSICVYAFHSFFCFCFTQFVKLFIVVIFIFLFLI